jgi:hypothetical protein
MCIADPLSPISAALLYTIPLEKYAIDAGGFDFGCLNQPLSLSCIHHVIHLLNDIHQGIPQSLIFIIGQDGPPLENFSTS